MADRAVLFIDGNNWYHALIAAGVQTPGSLSYRALALKLIGPREWVGTRYYIGRLSQQWNASLYAEQRRFLARLEAEDAKITVHLGRIEPRMRESQAAKELLAYLSNLKTRIDQGVRTDLMNIARRHRQAEVMVEKAVDVMLAVDLVIMAERNEFDAAYILSADGDFTPAVQAVRSHGKKVYAASPGHGAQLASAVNSFIGLTPEWFTGCYSST